MDVKLLKTIVTVVKFYDSYLFSGCGDRLSIYEFLNGNWTLKLNRNILPAQNIHGIVIKDFHRILVFGYKYSVVLSFTKESYEVTIVKTFYCEDWIMDGKWLAELEFCLLTAHSKLILFCLEGDNPVSSVTCTNRCINYCGTIINQTWDNLIVLSGTVYNHIIIWSAPGVVLHELKNHKGVIFSLTCNVDLALIVSTSDDRSACVWQILWDTSLNQSTQHESPKQRELEAWRRAKIVPLLSVWGHTARVWASVIIDINHFATVGEDGMAIVWNVKDGKSCWSTKSSSSGAYSICCRPGELAVGGADSSLAVHNWQTCSSLLTPSPIPPARTAARRVVFNSQGEVVVCCEGGSVFQWTESGCWTELYESEDLSSYCIASPSPARTLLALASISGCVHLLRFGNKQLRCKKLIDGRIYSHLWLEEMKFLICGEDGLVSIWTIVESQGVFDMIMMKELVLPQSKERWPTRADLKDELLLVGDRHGSILFYNLGNTSKECTGIIRGVHKGRGASCVRWCGPNSAVSCGRDGTLRTFRCNNELTLESTIRLQVDWPADIVQTKLMGTLLLAFHHVYAEVIALENMRTVLRVKCGGGHRSWDWLVAADGSSVNIAFVSNKLVQVASSSMTPPVYLLQGYHGRAINSVCIVDDGDTTKIISGGEDCCVRVLSISGDSLSSGTHLSSIRDVISHQINRLQRVIFSAGGRQQIKSWILNQDGSLSEISCSREEKEEYSGEAVDSGETRYMALCADSCDTPSPLTSAFVASSDGTMRVYSYFKENGNFTFKLRTSMEVDKCLLCIAKCNEFIFTGTTSGNIFVIKNQELVEKVSAHSGGVNVLSVEAVNESFVVATGGDDTSVVLSLFNSNGHFVSSSVLQRHAAQVTGVALLNGVWLFSVGCDQVLAVWKFEITNTIKYNLVNTFTSPIADPHGLRVSPIPQKENSVLLIVYGIGIDVREINLIQIQPS